MQILTHCIDAEFWSAEYRERPIAILHRRLRGWFSALIRASPHGSIEPRRRMFVVK